MPNEKSMNNKTTTGSATSTQNKSGGFSRDADANKKASLTTSEQKWSGSSDKGGKEYDKKSQLNPSQGKRV